MFINQIASMLYEVGLSAEPLIPCLHIIHYPTNCVLKSILSKTSIYFQDDLGGSPRSGSQPLPAALKNPSDQKKCPSHTTLVPKFAGN